MHIIDINGKRIEITDLAVAIKQATMFADMQHEDETFKGIDESLKIYWKDVLMKLQHLQETLIV